jgi:hypothetical protein
MPKSKSKVDSCPSCPKLCTRWFQNFVNDQCFKDGECLLYLFFGLAIFNGENTCLAVGFNAAYLSKCVDGGTESGI